jgi:hypothetical protein
LANGLKYPLTLASVPLLAPLAALQAAETKPAKPNMVIFIANECAETGTNLLNPSRWRIRVFDKLFLQPFNRQPST